MSAGRGCAIGTGCFGHPDCADRACPGHPDNTGERERQRRVADEAEETELEHIAKSMALAVTMVGVAAILSVVAASVAVAMVHWLAKVLP